MDKDFYQSELQRLEYKIFGLRQTVHKKTRCFDQGSQVATPTELKIFFFCTHHSAAESASQVPFISCKNRFTFLSVSEINFYYLKREQFLYLVNVTSYDIIKLFIHT